MSLEAGSDGSGQYDPDLSAAMAMTGGYVNFLRENSQKMFQRTKMTKERIRRCTRLGKFVAYMRARPSEQQEEQAEREFSARLAVQHVRMAKSLAAKFLASSPAESRSRTISRYSSSLMRPYDLL